jgi:site-specific DNA-cytosine methylase/superfamily II DNA or RNA helicase
VPYKQAYIERNFSPPIIFRNIVEFIEAFQEDEPTATTAYGGRMTIPRDVDVLIAGTSCVDYSALNNKKKGIEDEGESGLTWHGALAYCRVCRPAIIIFENVIGADWKSMLQHYREIGYDCRGVYANTKDYYIPQTRQRGYMVCFDINGRDNPSGSMSKQWQEKMGEFRRFASSPVSSFLIPTDQVVQRLQARDDEKLREVDWSTCEITQMAYREDKRLGTARPFTGWTEAGTMSVPDNASSSWYRRQVERVLDTIDCSTLRKAHEGYDARYKTRVWDLSQNIYRFTDRSPFGVSGCITPDGIFFISDAGRVMSAEECLKLQGIPLEKISFTTETSQEQQDMAGNAMTSTVIGSALLAALIVGHQLIDVDSRPSDPPKKVSGDLTTIATKLERIIDTSKSTGHHTDVASILECAARAARMCYCEGRHGLVNKPLQQCVDCGHITHVACGGNPPHSYQQSPLLSGTRIASTTFEEQLKSTMPLRLRFDFAPDDLAFLVSEAGVDASKSSGYLRAVKAALHHDFSFARTRRTSLWIASYVAPHARLDMVVESSKASPFAEWRLYGLPSADLACGDWLRTQLEQPIAKAQVTGDSLLDVQWRWRRPLNKGLHLTVESIGPMVPTWWARNGMPDYRDDRQPDRLRISAHDPAALLESPIDGDYRYLPQCGKACNSLYVREQSEHEANERPVYLFLDPTRTGPVEEDSFIFSYDSQWLEYDEVRPIIARVSPDWVPWPKKQQRNMLNSSSLILDAVWQPLPTPVSLLSRAEDLAVARPNSTAISMASGCRSITLLTKCSMKPETLIDQRERPNKAEDHQFLMDNAWVFEAIRRSLENGDWQALLLENLTHACATCAPPRPQLRWKLADNALVPYEDSVSATDYERAIKSRPPIFLITSNTAPAPGIEFGVNVASLAHRALARLPNALRDTASVKWRVETAGAFNTAATSPAFQLRPTPDVKVDFEQIKDLSVTLFPKQKLSLAWMRKQEDGVDFALEESEEAVLPVLGWRAVTRASAPIQVRGGICADHPGFGKTITSLALIHRQFLESEPAAIRTELRDQQNESSAGLLPSSATLIICPRSLTKQWVEEIRDKLRYKDGVILIDTIADLAKWTIHEIETAKIVVVNRLLFKNDNYAERLAAFAGVPGPGTSSGRAFGDWLHRAKSHVPEHLRLLREASARTFRDHVTNKYRTAVESEEFKTFVPSRRLRGKALVLNKAKGTQSVALKAASPALDMTNIEKPLFEMFYFNRMIVDEFHQYDAREYAIIIDLQADKRWGLSGTPSIDDCLEVSRMAGLLGVSLPYGSNAKGVMKSSNRMALQKEKTSFEQFDALRKASSHAAQHRIHEIQQLFLDTFVTQNVADFAKLEFEEYLKPIALNIGHRALYAELSQHMNSLDMRLKKGNKDTDRESRLHSAVVSSETAEEALSKTAAYFEYGAGSSLDALVATRHKELNDVVRKLSEALHKARAKESDGLDKWIKIQVDDRTIGDSDAIDAVSRLLKSLPRSSGSPKPRKQSKKAEDSDGEDNGDEEENDAAATKGRGSGKNASISQVNTLCKRLVVAQRSLRFLDNVSRLQQSRKAAAFCQHPTCQSLPTTRVAISAYCGHAICQQCYNQLREQHSSLCPAHGCSTTMQDHHLLWPDNPGRNAAPVLYGAKIAAAMDILDDIRAKQDQAVLFVQYETQLSEVESALAARGIPALVVKDMAKAGQQISDFRTSGKKTVIVLNASDETAAGSNLQNANHVIFLSPLLRDSQYGYESTMAQAIGRVRRHGQKKQIYVYRLVALDTIDVDILEHREKRTDALVEEGCEKIVPPPAAVTLDMNDKPNRERTQLVRENGKFSLQPRSWLVRCGADEVPGEVAKVKGKDRVLGWEDFSSLIKFSRAYTEDDD